MVVPSASWLCGPEPKTPLGTPGQSLHAPLFIEVGLEQGRCLQVLLEGHS